MEMRTLARCLRPASRPMILLRPPTTAVPATTITRLQFPRYNSSSNPTSSPEHNASSTTPSETPRDNTNNDPNPAPTDTTNTKTPSDNKFSMPADIDAILDKLNLSNRHAAKTTASIKQARAEDLAAKNAPSVPIRQRVFKDDFLALSRAVSKSAGTSGYRSEKISKAVPPAEEEANFPRIQMKLGPSLGRQVIVDHSRGVDLASALRTLNANCATNKVRSQSNAQKFHVRRGQMKKNLRMARWRRLFKFSFNATVAKIKKMRAQGW